MITLNWSGFASNISFLGRTWIHDEIAWFNWSASGFRVRFTGKTLTADIVSREDERVSPYQPGKALHRPVIGVRIDGGAEIVRRTKLTVNSQCVTLFDGPFGEHTVEVRKLSENVMGKCGLTALKTDGCFLPPPAKKAAQLEVVGDSITCGYGIESAEPGFRTEDENALAVYGFLAAEELGMEYSAVCVSGCSVEDPVWLPYLKNRGMLHLYAYTDAPMERALQNPDNDPWDLTRSLLRALGFDDGPETWDFEANPQQGHRCQSRC